MKKLKRISLYVGLGLLVFYSGLAIAANVKANSSKLNVASTCQPNASTLLSLINQERVKVGAPALITDTDLATSAHNKLNDEVTGQYYGHNLVDGRDFSTFIRTAGVNAAISEDLDENALNPTSDWTAFKNSPAHYASLTDPQYTRVGIAQQCTDYTVKTGTGPDDNSSIVGVSIKELTVVHLAGVEPQAPAPPPAPIQASATHCSTTYYPAIHYFGTNVPGYSKTTCN